MIQGLSINQHQFDSLISFSYNCGTNALKTSTLLKDIRNGAELHTIKVTFVCDLCVMEKNH
ncbi:glycoside hydrolase family protein [Clostridium botulinum]|uniref:glycoside hydrolase family protein n=1 Tax=Clostridium botulinum TaxID=1491 RepID=UPI003D6F87E9